MLYGLVAGSLDRRLVNPVFVKFLPLFAQDFQTQNKVLKARHGDLGHSLEIKHFYPSALS